MQYVLRLDENDQERAVKTEGEVFVCPAYGFHIIDVPDLDTALSWATRCPSAARGRVELRPFWPG